MRKILILFFVLCAVAPLGASAQDRESSNDILLQLKNENKGSFYEQRKENRAESSETRKNATLEAQEALQQRIENRQANIEERRIKLQENIKAKIEGILDNIYARLTNVIERLQSVADRLENRINEENEKGKDTGQSSSLLQEARNKIKAASDELEQNKTILEQMLESEVSRGDFREVIQNVRDSIREARQALKNVLEELAKNVRDVQN